MWERAEERLFTGQFENVKSNIWMKSHEFEDEESMCFGNCSEFVSQLLFVILGKLSSASGFFFLSRQIFLLFKGFFNYS